MAITVGTTTQNAVQAQAGKSTQTQTGKAQNKTDAQSGCSGKAAVVKAALAPSIKQAAQLVSGPAAQVAVKAAAGAVGALLDTKA